MCDEANGFVCTSIARATICILYRDKCEESHKSERKRTRAECLNVFSFVFAHLADTVQGDIGASTYPNHRSLSLFLSLSRSVYASTLSAFANSTSECAKQNRHVMRRSFATYFDRHKTKTMEITFQQSQNDWLVLYAEIGWRIIDSNLVDLFAFDKHNNGPPATFLILSDILTIGHTSLSCVVHDSSTLSSF